jgi:two-component sensor histidine kinase
MVAGAVRRRADGWRGWFYTAGIFGSALAARFAFAAWLDPAPFLTLFPAVMVTALLCGWRHGAAVLALSVVAFHYFFVEPTFSSVFRDFAAVMLLAVFLCVGTFLLLLIAALGDLVRRLDTAVQAREVMIKELQHRVANNMQIVASLFSAARRDTSDTTLADLLDQAAARVRSMAILHRRLHDSNAYRVGLEAVLRDVLTEAFAELCVEVRLDVSAAGLSVRAMTAAVLLVNEAAINAAKHVFRPGRGSRFEVSLRVCGDAQMQLTIRDDGPGLGQALISGVKSRQLGMGIMRSFARQLGGELVALNGPGTALRVAFEPMPARHGLG